MVAHSDCEKVRDLISLDFDGEITDPQRSILEAHLDVCTECRKWEQSLQSGLESIDSDYNLVSGELGGLLKDSLRSEDLQPYSHDEQKEVIEGGLAIRRALTAIAVLLIGIFGFVMTMDFDRGIGLLTSDAGGEVWISRGADRIPVSETDSSSTPSTIYPGDRLESVNGFVTLRDSSGLKANVSGVTILDCISNRRLRVVEGEVRFQLEHGQGPLEVVTKEVGIIVSGTEFVVRRWSKLGRTEVFVLSGEVMVQWAKRIPLPVRRDEWIEVSDQGFMFHSSPEPVQPLNSDPVPRPSAGIGGARPQEQGVRLFRDIPSRVVPDETRTGPLDMPVEPSENDPDGDD